MYYDLCIMIYVLCIMYYDLCIMYYVLCIMISSISTKFNWKYRKMKIKLSYYRKSSL